MQTVVAGKAMKRLFFALWPNQVIRRQCSRIMARLPEAELRPVAASNLHVTLLFLGGVNAGQQAAIAADAASLAVSPMRLTFNGLSYWQKPGILCLTSNDFDQQVTRLSEQLATIVVRNGVSIDERRFRPHVTLARKARQAFALEFEPIVWRSDDFCLVESCSLADGVEYRVLQRWGAKGLSAMSK
ncbi:MAG: RNA 2',3'-cyclic phosphodiesterase [Methylococcales bacterium]|nr:RNA 2',3'-cyclic phosphodiesterase [Methylococcales bacterium]